MNDSIRTGKGEVSPDSPAHTPGINQGNARGNYEAQPGHLPDGRATPERSTGVNPGARKPIHPAMPTLTPG
jgi:hypothetical protein